MNITVEKIPSYKIAYIRRIGHYGEDNVSIMEKLKNWAKANNLLCADAVIIGIAWDNPQFTNSCECRYDTCIVIKNDFIINENYICQGNISGGKYAVIKINHTADDVKKAWEEIFPALLKQHCQFDETRPILERYKAKTVKNNFCEICVPIN